MRRTNQFSLLFKRLRLTAKVKGDDPERKQVKKERDKIKWCGQTQDLHYKTQNHSRASEKGLNTAVTTLGRSHLPSFPWALESHPWGYQTSLRPLNPTQIFSCHSLHTVRKVKYDKYHLIQNIE